MYSEQSILDMTEKVEAEGYYIINLDICADNNATWMIATEIKSGDKFYSDHMNLKQAFEWLETFLHDWPDHV